MFKIGKSTDIHRLVADRDLIIGGVKIEHHLGLLGHSDADVLLHAIAESIIGALGLGDLGTHFPDNDPRYAGMDSKLILQHTYDLMVKKGYKIGNIDCLIIIEKPKMAPHLPLMKQIIADILHCKKEAVNLKATRGEKMGFVGRQEGVVAESICLLMEDNHE